jgi:hypothetical protein
MIYDTCRASTLHDQIIQHHEEHQLRATMASQQREEEAASQAFEATISESEDEMDDEDPPAAVKPRAWDGEAAGVGPSISAEEMQQNREEFLAIMEVTIHKPMHEVSTMHELSGREETGLYDNIVGALDD